MMQAWHVAAIAWATWAVGAARLVQLALELDRQAQAKPKWGARKHGQPQPPRVNWWRASVTIPLWPVVLMIGCCIACVRVTLGIFAKGEAL